MPIKYLLKAVGAHAKVLQFKHGSSDLELWTEGPPIQLGREVPQGEGFQFPEHWNNLSNKHCSLCFQEGKWLVKDTSTNGTFIDGVKIGKGHTAELRPGQRLGLSTILPSANSTDWYDSTNVTLINTLEYELVAEFTSKYAPAAAATKAGAPVVAGQQAQPGSTGTAAAVAVDDPNEEFHDANQTALSRQMGKKFNHITQYAKAGKQKH